MAARARFDAKESQIVKSFLAIRRSMDVAGYLAVTEAGQLAVKEGDAHIAAKRLPRGLRSTVQPKKPSLNASATITHRMARIGVFEFGGPIQGKPLLWLPIEQNLPSAGRQRWTPRRFVQRFGNLASARGPRPLLIGTVQGQTVPVFHGVRQVNIRKRLDVAGVVAKVVAQLFDFYNRHLKF